ncbi:DUF1073 domain-containing protein [Methylobacterium nodulans]|uniref:Phage-associated protein, HI1409 family n=1 Tax=Methylobacterium nodulans (strain LMG 21967 / CNCM I-2342 / ORS 2060) TaxID=460265 RepID=B8IDG2_METNO|nr:DUF1073 domain-containing protein [Methylobacterium nodulans]ACL61328.1 phage-associated protein, HI1409 family [Methylobacterium nodulans ORS 2060]
MWLADRLANLLTGLGGPRDKGAGALHVHVPRGRAELDAAYRDNWLARKIVDVVPFDMLREWRQWQAAPAEVASIEAAETRLRLREVLLRALRLARLHGGAAILIGDGAPDPAAPLLPETIGPGGLRYLHALGRDAIRAGAIERDPLSPWFGEPAAYAVAGGQTVHPSRVIRLVGAPVPEEAGGDAFGDSVLQALLEAIDQATSAAAHIAAMLPEAKQDVISVPGLSQALATEEGTRRLTERFGYAASMKSMFGMLLLEGDGRSPEGERYQQKQLDFSGLPEVARLFLQTAAGAADIPVTRLLGQSPAGLDATGDADLRNYYDHIAARQAVELTPALARLDALLLRHALGRPAPEIWYAWRPLLQTSERDKAEIGRLRAETAALLARENLTPRDVLAAGVEGWLVNADLFPGIEAAYRRGRP